jgi:hypothetical protein
MSARTAAAVVGALEVRKVGPRQVEPRPGSRAQGQRDRRGRLTARLPTRGPVAHRAWDLAPKGNVASEATVNMRGSQRSATLSAQASKCKRLALHASPPRSSHSWRTRISPEALKMQSERRCVDRSGAGVRAVLRAPVGGMLRDGDRVCFQLGALTEDGRRSASERDVSDRLARSPKRPCLFGNVSTAQLETIQRKLR